MTTPNNPQDEQIMSYSTGAKPTSPPLKQQADDENSPDRLLFLSDGVFAIAITLLVLEIKVPGVEAAAGSGVHAAGLGGEATMGSVMAGLLAQWPQFLGYVLSFVTIGIMWANHCVLFRYIKKSDHILMTLNTLLLLTVAFVPWATALLAEYLPLSPAHQKVAVLAYSLVSLLMALCFNLLWRYASHHQRLLDKTLDPRLFDNITKRYRFGPLWYVGCALLAFWSVPACLGGLCLLALLFALPYNRAALIAATEKEERAFMRIFRR